MKQVESSAKTREEAIENALKDLGVEMYEVDKIEILDEGSKGFFGLGARPVRVKLIVENMPDEPKRSNKREPRESRESRERRSRNDRGGRDNRNRNNRGRDTQAREGNGKARKSERTEKQGRDATRQENKRKERPKKERNTKENTERKRSSAPVKNQQPEPKNEPPVDAAAQAAEEASFASISDEQGKEAAALLQEVIQKMGIINTVEFARAKDGSARLNVESPDSAILIGRKGRNLSALQYLINRMISRQDDAENTERLVVDVEGYVDRRRAALEDMARTFAKKAKDLQRNMRLKPMSPQERRIIHLALQDDDELRTFSLGDSLYRSIIISPKNARQDRSRNNNRGGRGRNGHHRHNVEDDFDAGRFGD